MIRARSIFAVTVLLVLAALQGVRAEPAPPQIAQLIRGPAVHTGTGLTFPESLAGARLMRTTNYADHGRPDLGHSYHYGMAGGVAFSIYVYGEAERPAPGPDGAVIVAHYEAAAGDIREIARRGRYRELSLPDRAERCSYGAFAFRCATFTALRVDNNMRVFGRLLVTGYKGHILKIRIDWAQDSNVAAEQVQTMTQTLLGAILR